MSSGSATEGFGLQKIDYNTRGWHTEEYANLDIIDGVLSALAAGDANIHFGVDGGIVNAVTVAYNPAITAYTSGMMLTFKIANAVTGSATINANGLGAKTIKKNGANLVTGDIPVNAFVRVIYDGTNFNLITPMIELNTIDDGSVTPAKLSTGAPVWDASGNVSTDGTLTVDGQLSATTLKEGTKKALVHAGAQASGSVTFSTADPSGGSDGDVWFKYA